MSDEYMKKAKISIIASLIFATVSSFSLCFIPLVNKLIKGRGALDYIVGIVFWTALLLTIVSAFFTKVFLSKKRNDLIRKKELVKQKFPGIISFSFARNNLIIYGITLVGLLFMVTDILIGYLPAFIMYPIISITILSFIVHCIIDGKYYKVYIQTKESSK